jgi:hypothetical protein
MVKKEGGGADADAAGEKNAGAQRKRTAQSEPRTAVQASHEPQYPDDPVKRPGEQLTQE